MAETCYRCGAVSEVPGAFVKMHRSFRLGVYTCCRACFGDGMPTQQPVREWNLPFIFLLLGPGLLFLYASESAGGRWLLLNVFLLQMFALATIWPHELGHALTSRALGLRVFKIFLGVGKTLFTRTVFGFETEFGLFPFGGRTLIAHRKKTGIRCRAFGSVLAGPAVNLALGAAVLLFMPWEQLWRFDALQQGMALGQVFFYANFAVLALNLLPWAVATPLGMAPSDGKALWQALFGKQDPGAVHAQWFFLEGVMLQQSGKPAEAMIWYERGLDQYPENLGLLAQRARCLCELQRWQEARQVQLTLLAREDLSLDARAYLLNVVAYSDVVLGGEEMLPEADRYSLEAMAALGWNPAIKSTRGAVLVLLGRIQEGLPLLRESLERTDYAQGQAENNCWLAMGHARLGELDEARKHIVEARRLQPDCFLLERADLEVERGSEPVSQ